jgi:hypothetical protein
MIIGAIIYVAGMFLMLSLVCIGGIMETMQKGKNHE